MREGQKPRTLLDLRDTKVDLSPVQAFFINLDHGLEEGSRALIQSTGQPILTISLTVIERVWRKLPPAQSSLGLTIVLADLVEGIAYSISHLGESIVDLCKSESAPLLLEGDLLEHLLGQESPFIWPPSLSFGSEITQSEYSDLISRALSSSRVTTS